MELDKNTLAEVIRGIIREELGKADCRKSDRQIDPSGIISLDPRNIELEDFPFPVDAKRVKLKDLFSLEESPRIGAGIMEMENTKLDWTLTYDEIDYVISGTLEIIIDGRKVVAREGDVLYIPKNSSITFSAPDKARFFYVVYPANWPDTV
jgi:ethanolamine utilization protein EutQ